MNGMERAGDRPDLVAASRGGDHAQGMEDEGSIRSSTLAEAEFWRDMYRELLLNERKVMERVQELMSMQSPRARREVELTNVPVIQAQAERFRVRMTYWQDRIFELG